MVVVSHLFSLSALLEAKRMGIEVEEKVSIETMLYNCYTILTADEICREYSARRSQKVWDLNHVL